MTDEQAVPSYLRLHEQKNNVGLGQILTATRYEKGTSGSLQESQTTTYIYGNGLVSQYTEENGTEYYHYNNIGSTMYLTKNGVKTHEFAYSTYGELTKGEYGEVRFMYNGRLGVATDDNGLYYMRARYYNSEIRRFVNQDIVTGSIENSQSLNRYAYCQGNPVNYLDPFGLSPQSFGSWVGHTVLNLLSFVPVFGNAADAFNAIWYAYEGNYAEAIACAVGAIPLIGNLATGFKIGSKVVKGCNIAANGGKAAIGFYNGVQNVMNIDRMIRTGTGRWYDYLGQGVQFGLNMFVSAVGVSGAWNGISNLVDELNYKKMQKLAQEVSWNDIDGGPELTELLENIGASGASKSSTGQVFLSKGYNPQPGERTLDGYVRNNANPEISLTTQSSGFNNNNGNVGGVFKRFGAESHGGISPHVHQPQRNVAPNGNIYGSVGSKTSNGGVTSPSAKDVKQLYEYLNNGKYQ